MKAKLKPRRNNQNIIPALDTDSLADEIKRSLIPLIETKIRYYIDQRIGLLIQSNELGTRGSLNFSVNDSSWVFKSNGEVVAAITNDGVLKIKNIWLNGYLSV